jgi:hypothetical protein
MKLTLPFPPSVNTYWRAPNKGPLKGRHMISEAGRRFRVLARQSLSNFAAYQSHQVLCVLWKSCCTRQTTVAGTSTTTPKGCLTR